MHRLGQTYTLQETGGAYWLIEMGRYQYFLDLNKSELMRSNYKTKQLANTATEGWLVCPYDNSLIGYFVPGTTLKDTIFIKSIDEMLPCDIEVKTIRLNQ